MPILAEEATLYPSSLFEGDAPLNETWWVCYTMSRQEKALCRKLMSQRISFFLPTIEHRHRSPGGRARTSFLPLFANYVFVCGDEMSRYAAVSSGCVSRCLSVPDSATLVRDLRQIKTLIDLGAPLSAESRLEVGSRVRVKSGPFRGVEGTVIERRGQRRLFVAVNLIQHGASMEVGDWELESIA